VPDLEQALLFAVRPLARKPRVCFQVWNEKNERYCRAGQCFGGHWPIVLKKLPRITAHDPGRKDDSRARWLTDDSFERLRQAEYLLRISLRC
jgi:hypothetical protein